MWKPRKSFRYRWQSQADGVVVYNVESNTAFRLNDVAGAIWRLCDGTLDEPGIAERVAGIYPDAEFHQVTEDVSMFLAQMKNGDMIV